MGNHQQERRTGLSLTLRALLIGLVVGQCSPALINPAPAPSAEPRLARARTDAVPLTPKEDPRAAAERAREAEAMALLRRLDLAQPTPAVPLEDPYQGMNHFYEQLRKVAHQQPGHLARIAFYSDSINGNDVVSSGLRRALQHIFGDGGKGWIPIAPGWPSQQHRDVLWHPNLAWSTRVVNRNNAPQHRYGLGGVLSINMNRSARSFFATTPEGPAGREVARVQLYYQAWPRGGEVAFRVDDDTPIRVATAAPKVEDRLLTVDLTEGPHEVTVGVHRGSVRLYGVVMERNGPGVVVDGLMLVGARSRRMGNFEPDHLRQQVQFRQPDLLVFWLGANDAEANQRNMKEYLRGYGVGIAHARAGRPEASCLVVSVADQGEAPRGHTKPRIPGLVQGQREVAMAQGCSFFNLFEAMGGRGAMRRWFRAKPRLVGGDFLHLTPSGSRRIAQLINQVLLGGFAHYLNPRPLAEIANRAGGGSRDGTS